MSPRFRNSTPVYNLMKKKPSRFSRKFMDALKVALPSAIALARWLYDIFND